MLDSFLKTLNLTGSYMEAMNFFDWSTIVGLVAVLGFLWRLKEEIHKLGERVAKIEGSLFHPPTSIEREKK